MSRSPAYATRRLAVCVDVGSTSTKAAVVDLADGSPLATAEHPTTWRTDVLHGVDALLAALATRLPGADLGHVLACSSAGGGLRLAVVGYERVVTAEAGHRVGLSAGARVVHVAAGPLDRPGVAALRASRPDVLLLVGGTDGGDTDVVRHNAARLAAARLRAPVVVAGNVDARDAVCAALARTGRTVVVTGNVLPRIGVLDPGPARAAIRDVFVRHVIGGKGLSRGPRFARLVRGATPDLVLTGVELLADTVGEVLVVDVGGATTDVYSVLTPDAEEHTLRRDVVGEQWRGRTVEGDLGVRWSAPGVVTAAAAERLLRPGEEETLAVAARRRADTPDLPAGDAADRATDLRLAELAVVVAVRRHARAGAPGDRAGGAGGRDLRGVRLVVGSGGVLRHAPDAARRAVAPLLADHAGGWRVPERAGIVVDRGYLLAAAGLLAVEHPGAATALAGHLAREG